MFIRLCQIDECFNSAIGHTADLYEILLIRMTDGNESLPHQRLYLSGVGATALTGLKGVFHRPKTNLEWKTPHTGHGVCSNDR